GPPARLGPESRYGLGVIIRPSPLGITYGHSGFMPGYMTELVYFPDLKVSVAVQGNTSVARATGRPLRTFAVEFARIIAREKAGRGPAEAGSHTVAAEAGNYTVPAEAGNYAVPAEAGNYAIPAEAGNYAVPAEAGNYAVPAEAGNYMRAKS